jgi:hypothetical protein
MSPMSSDAGVPVPRTAVPVGIEDPVERARAELKAALAAIEVKANIPKRVARATDRGIARAQAFTRLNPGMAVVAVIGAAAAIGGAVWGLVRLYTR